MKAAAVIKLRCDAVIDPCGKLREKRENASLSDDIRSILELFQS